MFQYIKGTLDTIGEDYIVIENGDIGYKIFTSNQTMMDIRGKHDKVILYTQMILREDELSIYGFSKREELKMFQLLTTVTGIGAKVALGILSSFPLGKLAVMIIAEDVAGLTKAQGVGKKTAQRIVLELKDKIDQSIVFLEPAFAPTASATDDPDDEAVSALMGLGYNRAEALSAIHAVKAGSMNIEDMIKRALKVLAK